MYWFFVDDSKNPLALRICLATSRGNGEFPGWANSGHATQFMDSLKTCTSLADLLAALESKEVVKIFDDTIALSASTVGKFTRTNPLGCTELFMLVSNALVKELLGCPYGPFEFADSKSTGIRYLPVFYILCVSHKLLLVFVAEWSRETCGILGIVRAIFGTAEVQHFSNGWHWHAIVNSDMGPDFIAKIMHCKEIREAVERVLNKQFCGEMPRDMHIAHAISRYTHDNGKRSSLMELPVGELGSSVRLTREVKDVLQKILHQTQRTSQFHDHHETCTGSAIGKYRCRGAQPQPTSEETALQLLKFTTTPAGGVIGYDLKGKLYPEGTEPEDRPRAISVEEYEETVLAGACCVNENPSLCDILDISTRDGPPVVITIKRPKLSPLSQIEIHHITTCLQNFNEDCEDYQKLEDIPALVQEIKDDWEDRNGRIAMHNKHVSMCSRANNALYPMSGGSGGRGAAHYVAKYNAKVVTNLDVGLGFVADVMAKSAERLSENPEHYESATHKLHNELAMLVNRYHFSHISCHLVIVQ